MPAGTERSGPPLRWGGVGHVSGAGSDTPEGGGRRVTPGMDPRLHRIIVDRLDGDAEVDDEVAYLVLAACEGPGPLAETLGGASGPATVAETAPEPVDPPAVYLRAITVEGFRGVGPACTLDLEPGPGLTLVIGRNGSGKSSFAEGLELCLTGSNRRWQERSAVWRDGWRNLHRPEDCSLVAHLSVNGVPGRVTATRRWAAGDPLDGGSLSITGHPEASTLDELGWGEKAERRLVDDHEHANYYYCWRYLLLWQYSSRKQYDKHNNDDNDDDIAAQQRFWHMRIHSCVRPPNKPRLCLSLLTYHCFFRIFFWYWIAS